MNRSENYSSLRGRSGGKDADYGAGGAHLCPPDEPNAVRISAPVALSAWRERARRHSSPTMTLDVYAHVFDEFDIAERVSAEDRIAQARRDVSESCPPDADDGR